MKKLTSKGVVKSLILLLLTTAGIILSFFVNAQSKSEIAASDPNIRIVGRIDKTDSNNILFAFPGVNIKAKFEGTSIEVMLTEYGSGTNTTTNYFNVIIDNGAPTVLKLSSSQSRYPLATGLKDTIHTIELFKRTESVVGKVAFKGFILDSGKSLVTIDPPKMKKIEFIGNSITCGYGNEISTTTPNDYHFNSVNENNYMAWGAIAARSLNAEYSCVAYSGRGMYQNNTGSKLGVLPLIYDQIIADDASTTWDHNNYVPDIVVINLGTNDFYAEVVSAAYNLDSTSFVNAYITFVKKLRTYYPNAHIICCVGSMMSDNFPVGGKHWTRIQNYVSSVRNAMNSAGDTKVHYLKLDPQESPFGEDWHPTINTQQKMANALVSFINTNIKIR